VTANSTALVTVYYANVSVIKVDITPVVTSPGGLVQWRMNISNPGQVALDPVFVTDTLPLGFNYSNAIPAPSTISADNRTINWTNVGPIAAGGSTLVFLNSTVSVAVANGTYNNTVTVIGTPPNGNNVTDSDVASVGIFAPAINLVKTLDHADPFSDEFNYTLNISNTGSVNITVTVVDELPFNLNFGTADIAPTTISGRTITWVNITNLTPGSSFAFNYTALANASGSYANNATATGVPPNGANVSDNDSAFGTVIPVPAGPSITGSLDLSYSIICPSSVEATVTSSGSPVSSASVDLIQTVPYAGLISTHFTNSSGKTAFTLPGYATYELDASKSGYTPATPVTFTYGNTTCPVEPVAGNVTPPPPPPPGAGPTCGDGNIDSGEQCDGSNLGGATCQSQGFDSGALSCNSLCKYDVSQCMKRELCNLTTVERDLVGNIHAVNATHPDGTPCKFVDIILISPDGTNATYKTDENGQIKFLLDFEGSYIARLAATTTEVNVLAILPPREDLVKRAVLFLDENRPCCLILLLIAILVALYYYYRRRKEEADKAAARAAKANEGEAEKP
jgi:uncharacterized repeat protein (TIGR01451 family)